MRELATRKKRVFVQANSNSGQGHVLHYITSFCVVFRLSTLYFWLAGKTETKQVVNRMSKWVEGGGSWKGHESGQAVFIFLAASRANFAAMPLLRSAGQNRHATQAIMIHAQETQGYLRSCLLNFAMCPSKVCVNTSDLLECSWAQNLLVKLINNKRQHGWVVRALDFQFGGSEFKSHSEC